MFQSGHTTSWAELAFGNNFGELARNPCPWQVNLASGSPFPESPEAAAALFTSGNLEGLSLEGSSCPWMRLFGVMKCPELYGAHLASLEGSHSSSHSLGKFYPLHFPFSEWAILGSWLATLGLFFFKSWVSLFGRLHLRVEVEFGGCTYTLSDLLFVRACLLICVCVLSILGLVDWDVSGLWTLKTPSHSSLLYWLCLWWSIGWEFPFLRNHSVLHWFSV